MKKLRNADALLVAGKVLAADRPQQSISEQN
jgi:hypothetical protein